MADQAYRWVSVTAAEPCAVCCRDSWCRRLTDGAAVVCYKAGGRTFNGVRGDERRDVNGQPYTLFRSGAGRFGRTVAPAAPAPRPDVSRKASSYSSDLTAELSEELADELRLPPWAVAGIEGVGYRRATPKRRCGPPAGWTFPEVDGVGRVVGISVRQRGGGKKAESGTSRGVTASAGWRDGSGAVYLVEGASDTMAMAAAGLAALGRPSNTGGVSDLAGLLSNVPAERAIVVVGENDDLNRNGRARPEWPGRAGAYSTAAELADLLGRPVSWTVTPDGLKDAREWLTKRTCGSALPALSAT